MKLPLMFLTLTSVMCINAHDFPNALHEDITISGCAEMNKETMFENNDNELLHADFKKETMIVNTPEFTDPISWTGFYNYSVKEQDICAYNRAVAAAFYRNIPENVDPPLFTSIYSKDDMQLGSENTLICHVTGFFPPPVTLNWTKNNVEVTHSAALSQFYPNKDGTYKQFSHLRFTPQTGDVYTCTVHHKGLQTPDTKILEVDISLPSVGPSVFCGVGLAAGLLGVATGTFFLIKGNQCN